MSYSNNVEMIKIIASGLGDTLNDIVFVGGSILELYTDDPAVSEARPTEDVDFIIEIATRSAYDEFESMLREKGFINDIYGPACRMIYKSVKVDIIATRESVAGFTNMWYEYGFKNKIKLNIDDIEINILPVEYFIASKFEAFKDRGKSNLIYSEDFEDIIYIFDGRNTILEDIKNSDSRVKDYLKNELSNLLTNSSLREAISRHLGYASDPARIERILKIFKEIINK